MPREIIKTDHAPAAIGTYSQAVKVGAPFTCPARFRWTRHHATGDGGMEAQIHRVFDNLAAVARAAGGSLADTVKLNVFLTDLGHFAWSTRSWPSTSRNPIQRGRRSESRPCRAARRSRWMRCWRLGNKPSAGSKAPLSRPERQDA
jgi:enamine deaminase RidA (YjgF/YER057c/UK114 family)